MSAATCVL